MPYCYHPFHGLEIESNGAIRPCCKFRPELFKDWPGFNVKDGINTYLNSDALKQLQDQFNNNEKPAACIRCWKDEETGLPSKRQLDADKAGPAPTGIKFLTLPLGNHCNLKCRICGPDSSTSWIAEHKALTGEKFDVQSWHKDPRILAEILRLAKDCVEIHIHGGEPFLLENFEHSLFLTTLVSTGAASNIKLHYSTNGTVFPVEDLWRIWKYFKIVDVQVSLDDYGKRFEYNRHPAKWAIVEDNLMKYKARLPLFQLSISTTVSVFTINYLDEFFTYIQSLGLPKPWLGRLHTPIYYQVNVLPDEARNEIKNKLLNSQHNDLRAIASWLDGNNLQWKRFVEMVHKHDKYRNEKFVDIFPELAKLTNFDDK